MKRVLVFKPDEYVRTTGGGLVAIVPGGLAESYELAHLLQVGDIVVQTGRALTITSIQVNGDVRVQAED